ncbi:hypothetical protein [Halalkalibacter urbisdiaboli]|uniref:hypothetical protein n=1 Tax=Halalkalibacter urbisdiaboli TaxID=1960589 RepID=UPI000B43CEF6|nr:hypothetical protein [Halalkalibacter urbisdiaboli]
MTKNKKENRVSQTYDTGKIGLQNEIRSNFPFDTTDRYAGDSVDKHKEMENANEDIAKEEISQINNNS